MNKKIVMVLLAFLFALTPVTSETSEFTVEGYVYEVDDIPPVINWTAPLDDNSSHQTYGLDWTVNVEITDEVELSSCNLSILDSVNTTVYSNNTNCSGNSCVFSFSQSTIGYEIGNWTFRVTSEDFAGNPSNSTITGLLLPQNTSLSVWDKQLDPRREEDTVITEGMTQQITMRYHTPGSTASLVNATVDPDGEFAAQPSPSGYNADIHVIDDDYAGYIFGSAWAVAGYVDIRSMDDWTQEKRCTPWPSTSYRTGGIWCYNDSSCIISLWKTSPVGNEPTYIYRLNMDSCSRTTLASYSVSSRGGIGGPLVHSGSNWYQVTLAGGASSSSTIIKMDEDFNLVSSHDVGYSTGSSGSFKRLATDDTYLYLVPRSNTQSTVTVAAIDIASMSLAFTFDITNQQRNWGASYYNNKLYAICETCGPEVTQSPWYYLNSSTGITGADCYLTVKQENINNEAMTEDSNGYYNYSYREQLADNATIHFSATCSKSGYETKTDNGIYHTGNWHTPHGYSTLTQHDPFAGVSGDGEYYFGSAFEHHNRSCSPITVEGRVVKEGTNIKLWAFIQNYSTSTDSNRTLSLYDNDGGVPTSLTCECDINISSVSGWESCMCETTEEHFVGEEVFVCVNDPHGIGLHEGGHAYTQGSWYQTDELAVTFANPWNTDESRVSVTDPEDAYETKKYLVATTTDLYTTDFTSKQLFPVDSMPSGWTITHASVSLQNEILVRLTNGTDCQLKRYDYYGDLTDTQNVTCNETHTGIFKVSDEYKTLGFNPYDETLTPESRLMCGNSLSSFELCSVKTMYIHGNHSSIGYDDLGGAMLVYAGSGYNPSLYDQANPSGDWKIMYFPPELEETGGYYTSSLFPVIPEHIQDEDGNIDSAGRIVDVLAYEKNGELRPGLAYQWEGNVRIVYVEPVGTQTEIRVLKQLSGFDWNAITIGHGNDVLVASNGIGDGSYLTEIVVSTNEQRFIYNPAFEDTVAIVKYLPEFANYQVGRDYTNLVLPDRVVTDNQPLRKNDYINGIAIEKIYDLDNQIWKIGKIPGMSVSVYVDDELKHVFTMKYGVYEGGPAMVSEGNANVLVDGSTVTLKFYSYNILQDTLEYEVEKGQLMLKSSSELLEVTDNVFVPMPFWNNDSLYTLVYANGLEKENRVAFNPNGVSGLSCTVTHQTTNGSNSMTTEPTFIDYEGHWVLNATLPETTLDSWNVSKGDYLEVGLECTGSDDYKADFSSQKYMWTSDLYAYDVPSWTTHNDKSKFNDLSVYSLNDFYAYDVCVIPNPVVQASTDSLTAVPTYLFVSNTIGDRTGTSLEHEHAVLTPYTTTTKKACFAGDMSFNNTQDIVLYPDTNYKGNYLCQYAAYNHSVLVDYYWHGEDYMPGECRFYDTRLEKTDVRQSTVHGYYSCRGSSNAVKWTVTFDGDERTGVVDLDYTEDPSTSGTESAHLFVYPPSEQDPYNSYSCPNCFLHIAELGERVNVDLEVVFLDAEGNEYDNSRYSDSFVITVGAEENDASGIKGATGISVSGLWGILDINNITGFAVANPLGFLLSIGLLVIIAPLILVLLKGRRE